MKHKVLGKLQINKRHKIIGHLKNMVYYVIFYKKIVTIKYSKQEIAR